MRGTAVKFVREKMGSRNLREFSRDIGLNHGYIGEVMRQNGRRIHNGILALEKVIDVPDDLVAWARSERLKTLKQAREKTRIANKQRTKAPEVPINAHNYPSPHPQPRMRRNERSAR